MTRRALITGISGFTGPYVADALRARGYEIHGAGRGEAISDDYQSHQLDLRSPELLEELIAQIRPHVVVHLAAIAFVAHGDITDMYMSNVIGTRNLLQALDKQNSRPEKILLASSANVYGLTETSPISEEQPYNPQNDYAVSKCAMEMMAALWQPKFPIIVARPFNYTGRGQSKNFLIPKIVDHFQRRKAVIELGNTDVYRDFSDVRMVADSYARLLESEVCSGTFNICSGVEHSLQYVIDTLAEIAGYEIEVRVNPDFVRSAEIKHLRGCNERLKSEIGNLDLVSLADTLNWMYESDTDNGHA